MEGPVAEVDSGTAHPAGGASLPPNARVRGLRRLTIFGTAAATLFLVSVTASPVVALAATGPVANTGTGAGTSSGTGAGDGGGTVSVGAGSGGDTGGGGTSGAGGSGSGSGGGSGSSGWICTTTVLVLNTDGPPPGSVGPGSWYSVTCTNQVTGVQVTQTEWIADQGPTPVPVVDPYSVALQAERSIILPRPTPHFDPSGGAVVNLPTWLWVDPGMWHAYQVTASVGPVSATAVAVPEAVTWTMGDGGTVVCAGPGTPYDIQRTASSQSTACSYSYATSSAGQSSPDGNPDDGAFTVSATVTWSVTWTSQGAAGGGQLPALTTSTSAPLRVQQVESVNSDLADVRGAATVPSVRGAASARGAASVPSVRPTSLSEVAL